MANSLTAVGVVLALLGGVFLGQGMGLIPGSFMTGDPAWALIGGAMVVGGVLLAAGGWRRRS